MRHGISTVRFAGISAVVLLFGIGQLGPHHTLGLSLACTGAAGLFGAAVASDREGLTRRELLGIAAALVVVAAAAAAIVYWISTWEWSLL